MKQIIKTLFVIVIVFTNSCQPDTINDDQNSVEQEEHYSNREGINDNNELIILYPEGTTENEKQMKRSEYGVANYKQCKCADENLELWLFSNQNTGNIDIEEKKETAKVDEDIEGVDENPLIKIHQDAISNVVVNGLLDNAFPKIVDINNGVTVAVLDTGIDYNYEGFPNNFLYNSRSDACSDNNYQEIFGWNFVANNNNPFDDYPGRHGTIITHIITSNLDNNNVPYQILPVKIANENGNINYFDALCGFQYAIKKENVKVVNMSFGWYSENYYLLNEFIQAAQEDVLVISSAGNDHSNNDNKPHYPSSYDAENILAITSLGHNPMDATALNPELASFSNYGINSVDLAAIGENLPFQYNNEMFYVSGTSYSAAYASFYSALLYQNGMSIPTLRDLVILNSEYSQNLQEIKYSAYLFND